LVADGDKVAARFTMRGTHNGIFMDIPPSGQPFVATSMAFYRLEGGKVVEETGLPDMLAILQQIGAAPRP
jgi:predicted ester cyclase